MLSTKIQVLTPSFYWKQDTSRRAYIALKLIKRDGAISSAEFGISRCRHGTRTYRNLTAASLQRAASLYPFGIRGFRPSAEARELARAEAFQNEFGGKGEMMSECTCVSCDECGGSGIVWFSFNHKYLGQHRCDDLDDFETCESCGGSGIDEMCDHCRELEEEAEYQDFLEWQKREAAEHGVHPTGLTVEQKEEVRQMIQSALDMGSA